MDKETEKVLISEIGQPYILWHGREESVLIHGDFHWDNLLMDDQGRVTGRVWGTERHQAI